MGCSANLISTCYTSSNLTFTATENSLTYHLAYFSNGFGAVTGYRTGNLETLTNNTPSPQSEVPVPATAALLALGLLGLAAARRKQA